MSTLDRRGVAVPQRADLTINFSSAAPVPPAAQARIGEGLDHARAILQSALQTLAAPQNFTQQQAQAYQFHIKVAHDQDAHALARVVRNLTLTSQELTGHVVLSDERAAAIRRFCEANRDTIQGWTGQQYASNAAMIAALAADDGWGDLSGFAGLAKKAAKATLLGKLQRWDLGRVLTSIGDTAGSVRVTSQLMGIYTRTRDRNGGVQCMNPQYAWEFAEDLQSSSNVKGANVRHVAKVGTIHIDFSMFESTTMPVSSRLYHACVLIHEATHKGALTADFAYTDDGAYGRLTTAQSVNNADSLAFLAISLFKDRLIEDALEINTAA